MYTDFLTKIYEKMNAYRGEHKTSGTSYNIFSVLEVEDKEVVICRMLCDLLNPSGQHGKGSYYLKMFLTEVLHISEERLDEYLRDVSVYKEYQIVDPCRKTERRIDIVVCNDRHFLPFEVKIFAGDQESQCYVYQEYAEKYDQEGVIYYLTPDGKEPSEYSLVIDCDERKDVLSPDKVRLISFSEDIADWLNNLIENENDLGMKWILSQFLQAIENFCGTTDRGVKNMIVDELLASSENLAAGIEIGKAIKTAQSQLIRRVMEEYKRQMAPLEKKYALKNLGADSWYAYEQQADIFYSGYSSYPGLNYKVTKASMKKGREIWLRIEIEWKLFVGFCLFDTNTGDQVNQMTDEDKAEVRQYLDINRIDNEDWWIYWRYLPEGTRDITDRIPEFKNMNGAAIELADTKKLEAMVAKSVKIIEEQFLSKIR